MTAAEIVEAISAAGIVGMGGAMFPDTRQIKTAG